MSPAQFKVVPPARGLDALAAAHEAVPLVPGDEADCCARVMRRTGVPARDEAREWLTFLRALELVEETDTGFRRLRRDPEPEALAEAFRERVYGAERVLSVLREAAEPLDAAAVYERFDVPDWERQRHPDPDAVWRERVERLLAWAALFGLATDEGDGYAV